MSESKVQGKNAVLTIKNSDDNYHSLYCAQSVVLTIETEQLPATSLTGAGFKGNKPGKTSWEVQLDGVLFIRDVSDMNWTYGDFTTEQARKNGVDLKLVFTNENGHYEQFTGHANPQTTTGSGVAGQLAKFGVRFVGDGAYERNAIIPPSTSSDVNRYRYIATGGETFFVNAGLIGMQILEVQREAVPTMDIIFGGTPSPKQTLFTSSTGRFDFDTGSPLAAGELVVVLYKS